MAKHFRIHANWGFKIEFTKIDGISAKDSLRKKRSWSVGKREENDDDDATAMIVMQVKII